MSVYTSIHISVILLGTLVGIFLCVSNSVFLKQPSQRQLTGRLQYSTARQKQITSRRCPNSVLHLVQSDRKRSWKSLISRIWTARWSRAMPANLWSISRNSWYSFQIMILFRKFLLKSLLNSISCLSVYSAGLNLPSMQSIFQRASIYTAKNSLRTHLLLLASILLRKLRRFLQREDSPLLICSQTGQYSAGMRSAVTFSANCDCFFPLRINPNLQPVSVQTYYIYFTYIIIRLSVSFSYRSTDRAGWIVQRWSGLAGEVGFSGVGADPAQIGSTLGELPHNIQD